MKLATVLAYPARDSAAPIIVLNAKRVFDLASG